MSSSVATKDLTAFLHHSFPLKIQDNTPESDMPHISHQIYPDTPYTDNEKVEISQWLTTSSRLAVPDEDEAKHVERLGSLNIHLSTRTTLLGSKPSVADLALYHRLAPAVKAWSGEERTGEKGYHHIVRHIDFVQNAPLFGLSVPGEEKVAIDPSDVKFVHKPMSAKEEKERKKKEMAAAVADESTLPVGKGKDKATKDKSASSNEKSKSATATDSGAAPNKKEKKDKQPKPQKAAPKETPLSPCLIDLRVGHILKAIPHPDADSLYVSTIACGDALGTEDTTEHEGQTVRTVCSGLNGLIPLSEMQNRKIIAVCNLKPVKMRGIKSSAMVLAASPRLKEGEEDNHKGPVELVSPPAEAQAGERVCFEGWEGEPEGVLNPKKKVWEMLQPGFTTMEDGAVAFDAEVVKGLKRDEGEDGKGVGSLKTKGGGICSVKTLKGATVR